MAWRLLTQHFKSIVRVCWYAYTSHLVLSGGWHRFAFVRWTRLVRIAGNRESGPGHHQRHAHLSVHCCAAGGKQGCTAQMVLVTVNFCYCQDSFSHLLSGLYIFFVSSKKKVDIHVLVQLPWKPHCRPSCGFNRFLEWKKGMVVWCKEEGKNGRSLHCGFCLQASRGPTPERYS